MGKLLTLFPLITLFISLSIQGTNQQLPSFSKLAEASSPAVVNISSSRTVKGRSSGPRGFNDPFYDDFFKRFFGEPPSQGQREREVRSGGSGFIISVSGNISSEQKSQILRNANFTINKLK